jgi:uncharacterized protein with NRDE domain
MTDKSKAYIAIIAFAFICIIGGFIIYGNHQYEKYKIAKAEAERLAGEYAALTKTSDAAIAAKNEEIKTANAQLSTALTAADTAKHNEAAITAKYEALKGETASLPADALSGNINAFIGSNESWPTAGGLFSFKRTGAERTLTLFYDGAKYQALYANGQVTIAELERAVSAATTATAAWADKYALRDGEYAALNTAYVKQGVALRYLERSIGGRRLKSFIYGTAVGVIAGAVIYSKIKK